MIGTILLAIVLLIATYVTNNQWILLSALISMLLSQFSNIVYNVHSWPFLRRPTETLLSVIVNRIPADHKIIEQLCIFNRSDLENFKNRLDMEIKHVRSRTGTIVAADTPSNIQQSALLRHRDLGRRCRTSRTTAGCSDNRRYAKAHRRITRAPPFRPNFRPKPLSCAQSRCL